jgi:hypothetical protein
LTAPELSPYYRRDHADDRRAHPPSKILAAARHGCRDDVSPDCHAACGGACTRAHRRHRRLCSTALRCSPILTARPADNEPGPLLIPIPPTAPAPSVLAQGESFRGQAVAFVVATAATGRGRGPLSGNTPLPAIIDVERRPRGRPAFTRRASNRPPFPDGRGPERMAKQGDPPRGARHRAKLAQSSKAAVEGIARTVPSGMGIDPGALTIRAWLMFGLPEFNVESSPHIGGSRHQDHLFYPKRSRALRGDATGATGKWTEDGEHLIANQNAVKSITWVAHGGGAHSPSDRFCTTRHTHGIVVPIVTAAQPRPLRLPNLTSSSGGLRTPWCRSYRGFPPTGLCDGTRGSHRARVRLEPPRCVAVLIQPEFP